MIYSFLFNKISKLSPFVFKFRVVLSMSTGRNTATTNYFDSYEIENEYVSYCEELSEKLKVCII